VSKIPQMVIIAGPNYEVYR